MTFRVEIRNVQDDCRTSVVKALEQIIQAIQADIESAVIYDKDGRPIGEFKFYAS